MKVETVLYATGQIAFRYYFGRQSHGQPTELFESVKVETVLYAGLALGMLEHLFDLLIQDVNRSLHLRCITQTTFLSQGSQASSTGTLFCAVTASFVYNRSVRASVDGANDLTTVPVSRCNYLQRKGRAGREAPGPCFAFLCIVKTSIKLSLSLMSNRLLSRV